MATDQPHDPNTPSDPNHPFGNLHPSDFDKPLMPLPGDEVPQEESTVLDSFAEINIETTPSDMLFDDMPLSESDLPTGDPLTEVVDLNDIPMASAADSALTDIVDLPLAEPLTGGSMSGKGLHYDPPEAMPIDPADALADLPPIHPAVAGSGWLDVPLPATPPPAASHSTGNSDIFSPQALGESDVIRSLANPSTSGSNILDAPLAGSSRFQVPEDATEDVSADLGALPQPGIEAVPSSELFSLDDLVVPDDDAPGTDIMSGPPSVPSADSLANFHLSNQGSDSGPDFNQIDRSEGGSHLFPDSDDEVDLGASDVNLMDPTRGSGILVDAGSSIFGGGGHGSKIDVNEIPLMGGGDGDDPTEAMLFGESPTEGASHIFDRGGSLIGDDGPAPSEIDYTGSPSSHPHFLSDVEKAEVSDLHDTSSDEGDIDWSLPKSDDSWQPSERMTALPGHEIDDDGSAAELDALLAAGKAAAAEEEPPARPARRPVEPARPTTKITKSAAESVESDASPNPRGWVIGTLIGLVAGVGGSFGIYASGLVPGFDGTATVPSVAAGRTSPSTSTPVASADDAQALLAAGDPTRALKSFEATGGDTVVVKAGRGQARWLARLREAAQAGTAVSADDAEFKKAEADLLAVVESADKATSDEEKQAAIRAQLSLGLMKEAAGDIAGAAKVYAEGATKFPAAKPIFETSATRLRLTQPAGKAQRLTPRQVEEFAGLIVVTVMAVQPAAGAEKAAPEAEAGFLFWEAANLAAQGDYVRATDTIGKARAAHDKRRLLLAGKGLNPLSDPLEQIFLRTCDDLRELWTLKASLYGHPQFGPIAKKDGIGPGLDKLIAIQKSVDDLQAMLTTAKTQAEKDKKTLTDDLTTLDKKWKDATEELTKLGMDKTKLEKDLTEAKKSLEGATTLVTDSQKKLKAAEANLLGVVKELKANKLIDEKDDPATALEKLPAVIKQASVAAASADAKKAAEALEAAGKKLEAAMAGEKKAKEEAVAAMAALEKSRADAEKAVTVARAETKAALDKVDAEAKKAATAAEAKAQAKIDEATAAAKKAEAELYGAKMALAAERKQAEAELNRKLIEKEEQLRKQLADARAGVTVPLTAAELLAKDRAQQAFQSGVDFYFAGRYAEAEAMFQRATKDDRSDARYWYFQGLSAWMQGNRTGADQAFKTGAEYETRGMPGTRSIASALERVQGPARQALSTYRP